MSVYIHVYAPFANDERLFNRTGITGLAKNFPQQCLVIMAILQSVPIKFLHFICGRNWRMVIRPHAF